MEILVRNTHGVGKFLTISGKGHAELSQEKEMYSSSLSLKSTGMRRRAEGGKMAYKVGNGGASGVP